MAINFVFSSLSFGASVDQQTGSLSVFEIAEEIRAPSLPFHLPGLVISMIAEKRRPDRAVSGALMIHLIAPDGQQFNVGGAEMGIPLEQLRMKAVFRIGNLPISQSGKHRFVLSWMQQPGAGAVKEAETLLDFNVVDLSTIQESAGGGPPPGSSGMTH